MKKFFKSSLFKDAMKTIKNTKSRFIAIILMTGLSAAVFIGLQSGVPNLKNLIVEKTNDYNMHDIKIHSYTGIREKDKSIIEDLEGIKYINYVTSSVFDVKDKQYSIKLYSKTNNIDTAVVKEGRLPETKDEISLDYLHFEKYGNKIGEYIYFEEYKNEDENILKINKFKIVGYIESLDYIANTRVGGTEGDFFGIVFENVIEKKYPDYALVTLASNVGIDFSSNEFKLQETKKIENIRSLFEDRPLEIKEEILNDANEEINDAKEKINDAKNELEDARLELEDAKKELDDAKIEIEKGEKELADSKIDIENARTKLENGKKEIVDAENTLINSKEELDKVKNELEDGKNRLEEGKALYFQNENLFNNKMKEAHEEINNAQNKINNGYEELNKNEKQYLDSLEKYENGLSEIKNNNQKLNLAINDLNTKEDELISNKANLIQNKESISLGLQAINNSIAEIKQNIPDGVTKKIAQEQGNPELLALFENLEKLEIEKESLEQNLQKIESGISEINFGLNEILSAKEEINSNLELLKQEEQKLINSKQQLDQAKLQIENAKNELQINQDKLNESKNILEKEEINGKEELKKAKEVLVESEKKYSDGVEKYNSGLQDYQNGVSKLEESKILFQNSLEEFNDGETKYLQGIKDLEEAKQKYQDGLKEYNDGKLEFDEKSVDAENDIKEAEDEISKAEDRLDDINVPSYNINGKYGDMAVYNFVDQANSLNLMSYIFSILFYLVAILVTITTILRMVETERTQIGTLKALGYSRNKILLKYLSYGILAALFGSIVGVIVGRYILMPPIVTAYTSGTVLTGLPGILEIDKVILIIGVTVLLIGIATYFTVNRSLRENAASLMRPKAPKKVNRTLIERIPFIWEKLSFLNKVSVRNLLRSKVRMLITIIGVAGSFGLIAMGFGIQTSIDNVAPKQFGDIYKFNAQVIYDKNAEDYDDFENYIKENSELYLSLIYQSGSVKTPEGFNEDINIMATESNKFDDFISIRNRRSHKPYNLEDGKVIISEKLSKNQKLHVGDEFVFKDKNGNEKVIPISAITEQYFNHVVYMTEETYKDIINSEENHNAYLLKLNSLDEESSNYIRKEMSKFDSFNTFIPVLDLQDRLNDLSKSLNTVILLVILVSALLSLVVLYNLTDINISERIREISTIKVLGFRPKEVLSYIFKENAILTFIGMILGIFSGKAMHNIIVHSLSPGAFQFDPQMKPLDFIYAAILTIVFTIIVMFLAKRSMDKINMVESLKSIE